jgi:hypothetical protein
MMVEKRAVAAAFPEALFVTFNGSEFRDLFPATMPIFLCRRLGVHEPGLHPDAAAQGIHVEDRHRGREQVVASLIACAAKWYRGEGSTEQGALDYHRMNMVEKRAGKAAATARFSTMFMRW